jgi:PTH1 family peptidyl-tRNA hydrolase
VAVLFSLTMTTFPRPVNFVIVGLGNVGPEYKETRHNAGYIFINYLSNALELAKGSSAAPIFQRLPNLQADVLDTTLMVSNQKVTNSLRILLVKPLTMMNDAGSAVKKVLDYYGIAGTAAIKQRLIVIADDLNTLPGCLSIQIGGTLRSLAGHKGVESICQRLETTDYVRYAYMSLSYLSLCFNCC